VVAGATAGLIINATRRRPARVHHVFRERVVVVRTVGSERVIRLVCPGGVYEGNVMQIEVDGAPYFVTVPPGVVPGMTFDVKIQTAPVVVQAPVAPKVVQPAWVPPAAIVSDNHGKWTRVRYESLRGAEHAWSRLGMMYASVLFVQNQSGGFTPFKEWGTGKAVDQIKRRFRDEFKFELFPELRPKVVAAASAPAPVVVASAPVAAVVTQPPPPPSAGAQDLPPAYGSAPPTAAVPSAPPAYGAP